jgi:hypothetical protein
MTLPSPTCAAAPRFARLARPTSALSWAVITAVALARVDASANEPALTGANEPTSPPRSERGDVSGELRLRGVSMGDFALDALGTKGGRARWLESRVMAGGRYRLGADLELVGELEALNGLLAGDTTSIGLARGEDSFDVRRDRAFGAATIIPRKLYVEWDVGVGVLRIGQQAFSWGLGMLANDGSGDREFGDPMRGNLVERVLFATRPFARGSGAGELLERLTLFAATDLVFRDESASLLEGDLALAGVLGAKLTDPRFELGALAVGRWQRDRRDPADGREPETAVFVGDVTAKLMLTDPASPSRLILEGEAALIAGRTTRPLSDETSANGATVLSVGWVTRLRFEHDPARLGVKLEVGQASGDDDPRDATTRQFAFHSDYNVGLLLFDQVLPMVSARALDRVADPRLLGVPPSSSRFLVAQGGVLNATYLNPTLRWWPTPWLDVRLGYVLAGSIATFADPYNSARNGGYPSTAAGSAPDSGILGQEVDASLRVRLELGAGVVAHLGVEGGVFFWGAALTGLGDDRPLGIGRLLTGLRF